MTDKKTANSVKSVEKPKKPSIRDLKREFSPHNNPFAEPTTVEVATKKRYVTTGCKQEMADLETGEIVGRSVIHQVEEKDDQEFVKVFAEGIKASFSLKPAAARVFQAVLEAYQNEKMTGGFADCITLMWFDEGLNGVEIGMSDRTFNRGIKELLEKNFIRPKMPNIYWVNPTLFFKGNRVAFIKEYRRVPNKKQTDLEDFTGQNDK